jgi:hypothetical protein
MVANVTMMVKKSARIGIKPSEKISLILNET